MTWKKISPPINSPLVRYEKEWMSIYDFVSLGGMNPNRKVLNTIEIVFLNDSLFDENQFIRITATRYDDSVWISNFMRYESPPVESKEVREYLSKMDTINPDYTYYLGRCDSYEKLTKLVFLKVMDLTKSFKSLSFFRL